MFGESSFTAEHSSEQRIESADAALHKVYVYETIQPLYEMIKPL